MNPTFLLWAKTAKDTQSTHPLLFHLIDSAQVALALWELGLSAADRRAFSSLLGLEPQQAGRLIAFWSGLHDIGKASPAFQCKYPPAVAPLEAAGFDFPSPALYQAQPHGLVTGWALYQLLAEEGGLNRRQAHLLARALAGHHGAWPANDVFLSPSKKFNLGGPAWQAARRDLFITLRGILNPPIPAKMPSAQQDWNTFLALFSAFTTTADWIASMEELFPYTGGSTCIEDYWQQSGEQARSGVQALGWAGWHAEDGAKPFEQMFPFSPNAVQEAMIGMAARADLPALAVIEAPTGIGKTEIAFYLADTWTQRAGGRGLYVAMPTQATSNQMFGRTKEFLQSRYPEALVNLQLAHGQALWSGSIQEMVLSKVEDGDEGRIAAMDWFLPRKRTLLAPFGVGTVDQAFLAVLQTRHFFVRLFGLGNKVVIFDEVHAYDTYMNTLFCRLLTWLRAMNTSVIVLSATLPDQVRRKLVEAYTGSPFSGSGSRAYPQLTLAAGAEAHEVPLPQPESRTVMLERVQPEPEAVVRRLAVRLANGGCAAVICNTVARAQELYEAVRQAGIVPEEECILFHARFPFAWRKEKEQAVLDRFAKGKRRPKRSIVIATQVIEQSLDLDFDDMITELAPIDLLIQRAGRLHRHPANPRPAGLEQPVLAVIDPPLDENGLPDFGVNGIVYSPYLLLRTWLALDGRGCLHTPEDIRPLIEQVYDGRIEPPAGDVLRAALDRFRMKLEAEMSEETAQARMRLVLPPEDEDFLFRGSPNLEEDKPEVHQALQAMTRLGPPNISLVCLHKLPDGNLSLDPDDPSMQVSIEKAPEPEQVKQFLQYSVSVQDQRLVSYFSRQPEHRAWEKIPALRRHWPLEFVNGIHELHEIAAVLRLDRERGLAVLRR